MTMDTTFREITIRPGQPAETLIEPDGTVELHWPTEGLTVLLSREEADHLAVELIGVGLSADR